MIRELLRALRDKLVTKLTPKIREEPLTVQWLNKLRRDFKKQRLINPSTGKLDMRFNPLAVDDHVCMPVREQPGVYASGIEVGEPSEELAFLEWLEEKGINLPKKEILRNDDKWRRLDIHFNPLECEEDYFIPNVAETPTRRTTPRSRFWTASQASR